MARAFTQHTSLCDSRATAGRRRRASFLALPGFVAALSCAQVIYSTHANAAQARAYFSVSATVVDRVALRSQDQARTLVITARDVERGYVDAPAASNFQIAHAGPCILEFKARRPLFRAVRVSAPDGSARFGVEGGTLLRNAPNGLPVRVVLDYRFELDPSIRAGTYDWPLALTLLPM